MVVRKVRSLHILNCNPAGKIAGDWMHVKQEQTTEAFEEEREEQVCLQEGPWGSRCPSV